MSVEEARDLLDDLVEVNLVQADIPGRYRLHDLLRAYAETLVTGEERLPAILRMLDYYLAALAGACVQFEFPQSEPELPEKIRVFAIPGEGTEWMLEHWGCLMALVDISVRCGAHRHTALLARLATNPGRTFGFSTSAQPLVERALAAADALGDDDPLAARTRRVVAGLYLHRGRYAECHALLDRAEEAYRRTNKVRDATLQQALRTIVLYHEGRLREALALAERTVVEAEAAGDDRAMFAATTECGAVLCMLGHADRAVPMLERAYRGWREQNRLSTAIALGWLGVSHLELGRPATAGLLLTWAIGVKRVHGNVGGAAEALADYGRVVALQGDPEAGLRYQLQAFDEVRSRGDGYFEPIIGNRIGQTLTMLGRTAEAVEAHELALRDAGRRLPYQSALAHAGIAAALRASDPERAASARARAAAEFAAMGLEEAAILRLCPPA